ncbi:MAG TPA: hypothetical protein VNJ02_16670 [Vicinamibacterales bacterium]|nr:hypothetical protein [Vicinamibacterales bacterium]
MQLFAWVGAAAFAVSLTYLVYFYAVVLGIAAADDGRTVRDVAVNTALFSGFALHHSLLARSGAKAWISRYIPAGSERTVYVWIASLLLLAVCTLWQSLPGMVYQLRGIGRWLGYAIQVSGALVAVRAAGVIDVFELAGIRQARTARSTEVLRVVGPFRVVRHPIYLGWMLAVFGAPTMTSDRLLFATISSVYLLLAIPLEERSLIAVHGNDYRRYADAVRWRVIPGVW